jgi:hypothetical protein
MYRATLLMITTQQKEDLSLKGIALTVAVKIREEWVLLKDFENYFGIECGLQQAGKSGFTNSDDPFNGKIHE